MNLHLVILVDIDVDKNFVGMREVVSQVDFDSSIAETLVAVILRDNLLGTVYDVLGNLISLA